MRRAACAGLLAILASAQVHAAETRSAPAGHVPPAAKVADLAWLAGEWVGQGISGEAREVYSPPMGGQIAGHFIQSRPKGIAFYEMITIVPDGDSISYRLKHFNADLTGWEERAEVRSFGLVAREGDAWYFNGLTIRREGPDAMLAAVKVRTSAGGVREYRFPYRRVR